MHFKLTPRGRALFIAGITLGTVVLSIGCGGGNSNDGGNSGGNGNAGAGGAMAADGGGTGGDMIPDGGGVDSGPIVTNCGNMTIDDGEDCDDGNDDAEDGCDNYCQFTCTQTIEGDLKCSDHFFCNGRETCGPDHKCLPGTPAPDLTFCGQSHICVAGVCQEATPVCGDNLRIEPEEQCDDGNLENGDGCDSDCQFTCETGGRECVPPSTCYISPLCDDTVHTCSFQQLPDLTPCDLDPTNPGAGTGACIAGVCETEYCGNSFTETALGEECDDGNTVTGDGCEADCRFSCVSTDNTRDCAPDNPCFVNAGCDADHKCPADTLAPNGTACGSAYVCIEGNCRGSICGDGATDPTANEECDDGNNIDNDGCKNDCTFSCEQDNDCTGTPPPCRTWSCNTQTHRCETIADNAQENQTCLSTGTCKSGACTSGTCGNGTVEAPEQCDQANNTVSGDGCEPYCRYSCQTNADCDNGDACDGTEACTTNVLNGLKSCSNPTNLGDGTQCSAPDGATYTCTAGVCRQSFCGDGYTDATIGEECEPPNRTLCSADCKAVTVCDLTGTWAMHIVIEVSWVSNAGILGSAEDLITESSYIEQWVKVEIDHPDMSTAFTQKVTPCGLTSPDFMTQTTVDGGEYYGITIPNDIFDAGVPSVQDVAGTLSGLAPGSAISTASTAVTIGINMLNPFGFWMNRADAIANQRDDDEDTFPGITAVVKPPAATDPIPNFNYENMVVDTTSDPKARADRLYIAVRQISTLSGSLGDDCNTMSGTVNVSALDNHILGCHWDEATSMVPTGTNCTETHANLADLVRPRHQPVTATFEAVKIADGATCFDVRAEFP